MTDSQTTVAELEAMKTLTDEEVLAHAQQLMKLRRALTASALVHVAEMEARGLPPDFDVWCGSDDDPNTFLRAARVVREFPHVLEMFQESAFALSSIAELEGVLASARTDGVCAATQRGPESETAMRRIRHCDAGPQRYHVSFTVDRGLYEKLKAASDMLSEDGEEVPMEEVLVLALETLFESRARTG